MMMNTPQKIQSGKLQPLSLSQDHEKKESAWTSFDNSPVHPVPPEVQHHHSVISTVKQDDAWTTFSDTPSDTDMTGVPVRSAHPRHAAMQSQEGHLHPGSARIAKVKPVQANDLKSPGQPIPQIPSGHNTQIPMNMPPHIVMHPMSSQLPTGHVAADLQHTSQYSLYSNNPSHIASVPTDQHMNPRHQVISAVSPLSNAPINVQPSVPNISAASTHHSGSHPTHLNNMPGQGLINSEKVQRQLQREHSVDSEAVRMYDVDVNGHDSWSITDEQRTYYTNQFITMQPDLRGKIDGQSARNFFTKSRLPIPELSHIWELCDIDQDGNLTLDEFCAAFHLVVARKNGYDLPAVLPQSLIPVLIDIRDTVVLNKESSSSESIENRTSTQHSPTIILPQVRQPKAERTQMQQEKWETFSDRASSSTTLANFDQSVENTENLVHPIAVHLTPTRQEAHAARMQRSNSPKSTDGDSSPPPPEPRVPVAHRSLTNPYGSLTNDYSETDSGTKKSKGSLDRRRFPSSSSTSPGENVPTAAPTALRTRSLSVSSNSSVATSERSSEIDQSFNQPTNNHSDQEHSDWSSRPLRPRSGSDSSLESPPLHTSVVESKVPGTAPTPPPRPYQQAHKPGDNARHRTPSGPRTETHLPAEEVSASAPTPPPRPQQSLPTPAVVQQEAFADFSQFETKHAEVENAAVKESTTASITTIKETHSHNKNKPVPAPRHARDGKSKVSSEPESGEKSPETSVHKSAPAKPPRSRILSMDSVKHDQTAKTSIHITLPEEEQKLPECPKQEQGRTKVALQQSIRDLKLRNNHLTRLNAELQQELKDVMQSRITVEMSIHQLRPFSQ